MQTLQCVKRAIHVLPVRDQRILLLVTLLQSFVSLMDMVGILLLGAVAALGAASLTGTSINLGGLGNYLDQLPTSLNFLILLATTAAIFLILKSILSLILTRRIFQFIANRQALLSSSMAKKLFDLPLAQLQTRTSQEVAVALTTGVNAITILTLGQSVIVFAEISLVLILFLTLTFVNITVAIFTVVFFGFIGIILQIFLGKRAQRLGVAQTEVEIQSFTLLQQLMKLYRELAVSRNRPVFIERFQKLRWHAASIQADTYILNQVGKYVFEIGLVIGGGLLVALMSATTTPTAAVATIVIFLAASSRIFPALLRIQNSLAIIRNAQGISNSTLNLISELNADYSKGPLEWQISTSEHSPTSKVDTRYEGFVPNLRISQLSLSYSNAATPVLKSESLDLQPGRSLAIVGPSGSGKSSLVDAILGILPPTGGSVLISGLPPRQSIECWPGAISYVPQTSEILPVSVRENVALGVSPEQIDDSRVANALLRSNLQEFSTLGVAGMGTVLGEGGNQLSGGQRQRLGLARALYSEPQFLILDEATSALDAETEWEITQTLERLRGTLTLIVVAHRLATIREMDQVIYLNGGQILARGTFDEVRQQEPSFDRQAKLMGL